MAEKRGKIKGRFAQVQAFNHLLLFSLWVKQEIIEKRNASSKEKVFFSYIVVFARSYNCRQVPRTQQVTTPSKSILADVSIFWEAWRMGRRAGGISGWSIDLYR